MRTRSILYSLLWISRSLLGASICLLLLLASCSKPDPDAWLLNDPIYKGWLVESFENIRVYYAPGHPQAGHMADIARNYSRAVKTLCQTLGMPAPTDTLKVVYYTGAGQGQAVTKHEYPFGDSLGVARFWLPYAYGVPMAQLYVRKWDSTPTRHKFLWHGLIALFDFQGEDYHTTTLTMSKSKDFIPLAQLAVDTTINSDGERWQSAEAASFCAYLIGNYGVVRLRKLYDSPLPIEQALPQSLGISLDSAQAEWLEYARQASSQNRKEIKNDTTLRK